MASICTHQYFSKCPIRVEQNERYPNQIDFFGPDNSFHLILSPTDAAQLRDNISKALDEAAKAPTESPAPE